MVTSSVIPKSVQSISGRVGAFAAIGFFGYLVDAGITYLCAKYLNLSPELARPPGFVIATLMNFVLNRAITFRDTSARLHSALVRYFVVASLGVAVNFTVYSICVYFAPRIGITLTPTILPLFVAAGSGVAMFLTYLGFRFFAFG